MNIAREIQKNCIKFIQEQTIENNLLLVKVLTFGISNLKPRLHYARFSVRHG